ncbi:MAG: diphthine--ammonia ligase [Desulfurivibrionaceae bacterium]|nr:diphthine--ammonia ligase [Desulfobulbales bacterium]MDT8334423.1 diphthine--ammonia ligase [Desulfurivibrionaceae bacterium]
MSGLNGRDFFCSWSGGKDSCLALYKAIQDGGRPRRLLTMFGDDGRRSKSHNLSPAVIAAQAGALAIPSSIGSASWDGYEKVFLDYLGDLKKDGLGDGVFGDIDLVPHREWVERVCGEHGIMAHLPLWQKGRRELLADFIEAGFKAVIVVVDEKRLDRSFLGRELDRRTIDDLEAAGVDACGEEGEYHTVVAGGPIFGHDLNFKYGKISHNEGYGFLDVSL